jgi:uncharacterized protein YndB with AHSA1/START domain
MGDVNMVLLEVETIVPQPIEEVFALTVNLEKAPRWHSIFTDVQQITPDPIGMGSRWKISYIVGRFVLEITDYQPPNRVTFKGSVVIGGTIPNFTIELRAVSEGTRLRYLVHPDIPPWLKPLMAIIAPPYGKHDLERYFRELKTMLAAREEIIATR